MVRRVPNSLLPPSTLAGLRAVAEAIFSDQSGPPPTPRIDWLLVEFEDFLTLAGSRARLILRAALFAVTVLAPLFVLSLPPLRSLPLAKRVLALERMEASFASAAVLAVKAFLCVLYYEHPEVQAAVGFVGTGHPSAAKEPS